MFKGNWQEPHSGETMENPESPQDVPWKILPLSLIPSPRLGWRENIWEKKTCFLQLSQPIHGSSFDFFSLLLGRHCHVARQLVAVWWRCGGELGRCLVALRRAAGAHGQLHGEVPRRRGRGGYRGSGWEGAQASEAIRCLAEPGQMVGQSPESLWIYQPNLGVSYQKHLRSGL